MTTRRKNLRPAAVIPSELYVRRDADRQLERIIGEMGRPGYVLVARQMGKTNLLLNMKREREALGEVVVYVDLSTGFESARSLFRHIVDSILDAYPRLTTSRGQITVDRHQEEDEVVPEYNRHMRLVLSDLNVERLIIVLDEVDSLIKTNFSDTILAQVRSMYFSRVNYPIFERMTYVLSGVAEPTDLIKDKNISPFNIGEKIYLNDFTRSELSEFISRARLELSALVIDDIYEWGGGNPRMTWDICSALEDEILAGQAIDPERVEAAVKRLYLSGFALAPVDHIRVLVEGDRDIREAIPALRAGRGTELDEKTKSRLYLAGIVGALGAGPLKIKNKVLEAALSPSWLAQTAGGPTELLRTALSFALSGDDQQASRLYGEFVEMVGADKLPPEAAAQYGFALFRLGNPSAAAKILAGIRPNALPPTTENLVSYYLGTSLVSIGDYESGRSHLLPLTSTNDPTLRVPAKLALSTVYLAQDGGEGVPQAEEVLTSALGEIGEIPDEGERQRLAASLSYNLARVFSAKGDRAAAATILTTCAITAPPEFVPAIQDFLISLLPTRREQRELASRSARFIVEHGLPIASDKADNLSFKESVLASLLARLAKLKCDDEFSSLSEYALQSFKNLGNISELLVKLSKLISRDDALLSSRLLERALERGELTPSQRVEATRLLAMVRVGLRQESDWSAFLRSFIDVLSLDSLSDEDIVAAITQATRRYTDGRINEAASVLNFIRDHLEELKKRDLLLYVVALQQDLIFQKFVGDAGRAHEVASLIIRETSSDQIKQLDPEVQPFMNQLKAVAQSQLTENSPSTISTIKRNQKVTVRNTRTNGIIRAKYKDVEGGIRLGLYEFLSVAD